MRKLKIGDLVQCIEMPKTYNPRLEVGQQYKIAGITPNAEWIKVVDHEGDFEARLFLLTSSVDMSLTYELITKDGHLYQVKCSKEAMEELADIISDDHLLSYTLVPDSKKETKVEQEVTKAKILKSKKAS